MAYVTSNPPRMMVAGSIDNSQQGNIWLYSSADAATVVRVVGYFTNGVALGMKVGDLVFVYVSGTKTWTTHTVAAGTADPNIDLSDATTIGSATNSD